MPEVAGRGSKVFLDVADKIAQGGEAEKVADLLKGKVSLAEQSADVEGSVARNPVDG